MLYVLCSRLQYPYPLIQQLNTVLVLVRSVFLHLLLCVSPPLQQLCSYHVHSLHLLLQTRLCLLYHVLILMYCVHLVVSSTVKTQHIPLQHTPILLPQHPVHLLLLLFNLHNLFHSAVHGCLRQSPQQSLPLHTPLCVLIGSSQCLPARQLSAQQRLAETQHTNTALHIAHCANGW